MNSEETGNYTASIAIALLLSEHPVEALNLSAASAELDFDRPDTSPGLFDNDLQPTADSQTKDWSSLSEGLSTSFGAINLCLATLAIFLNILVVFSVFQSRRLRNNASDVMTCNLATGSLFSCILTLAIEVPVRLAHVTQVSDSRRWKCEVVGFVDTTLTLGTVWTLVLLGIEKYRGINSPMHHTPAAKTSKLTAIFTTLWACACLAAATPFALGSGYTFDVAAATCTLPFHHASRSSSVVALLVFYVGFVVCIPFSAILFCHWGIFAIARSHSKRMSRMIPLMTLSFHAPVTHNRVTSPHTHLQVSPRGQRAICTTCIFVAAFGVCYLPYAAVSAYQLLVRRTSEADVPVAMAYTCLRSACTVNAYIYGCRNKVLRDAFKKFARRKVLQYSAAVQGKQRERMLRRRRSSTLIRFERPTNKRRTSGLRPVTMGPTQSQPIIWGDDVTSAFPFLPRSRSLDGDLPDIPEYTAPLVTRSFSTDTPRSRLIRCDISKASRFRSLDSICPSDKSRRKTPNAFEVETSPKKKMFFFGSPDGASDNDEDEDGDDVEIANGGIPNGRQTSGYSAPTHTSGLTSVKVTNGKLSTFTNGNVIQLAKTTV